MGRKILAVFAHPDDEAFGPGGTLAKYASEGVEIHLLSATRGEAGQIDEGLKEKAANKKIHHIREEELLRSAEILGIKKVEFLNYIDGRLCNAVYHGLAGKILDKIRDFKPQLIVTLDRLGISGHLDHIAVSMITTFAFKKTSIPQKLYYLCLPQKLYDKKLQKYFIYFPEGYKESEITTRIDYTKHWDVKKKAMQQHASQKKDVDSLVKRYKKWPKTDHFILKFHRNVKIKFPETDLFAGLD